MGSGFSPMFEKCTLSGACVDVCYAEARQIAGHTMTVAAVMSEIERDITFYDGSGTVGERGGATFSGGEPLLQPEFLLALLEACRASAIHTALDTSGFARWEILDRVRPLVDLFLYDLKLMDPHRHRKYTLVFNTRILENLRRLSELGHKITLRRAGAFPALMTIWKTSRPRPPSPPPWPAWCMWICYLITSRP